LKIIFFLPSFIVLVPSVISEMVQSLNEQQESLRRSAFSPDPEEFRREQITPEPIDVILNNNGNNQTEPEEEQEQQTFNQEIQTEAQIEKQAETEISETEQRITPPTNLLDRSSPCELLQSPLQPTPCK
jgi:hypothetical protein